MNTIIQARKPHPWKMAFDQQTALAKAKKLGAKRVLNARLREERLDPTYRDARRATELLCYHNRKNKGVTTPATGEPQQ